MTTITYSIMGAAAVLTLVISLAAYLVSRRRPRRLNQTDYQAKWARMQKQLKDKSTWPLAVIDADNMLDDVLKHLRYKGKTTGERLVAAQRDITNNDIVWYGHKLRNRIVHDTNVVLREREVKNALIGIKHALKDLGAL